MTDGEKIPVFPDIPIGRLEESKFHVCENSDFPSEGGVEDLLRHMYTYPEREYYLFVEVDKSINPLLKKAVDENRLLADLTERFYYRHPRNPNDFVRIQRTDKGFAWSWEEEVSKTQEYRRVTLKLTEQKKREFQREEIARGGGIDPRPSRHLVITVHGIRTFGEWQDRLERMIKSKESDIDIYNYKYGYFSVGAFWIPFLRWLAVRYFRRRLLSAVSKGNWRRIDIVAHSFGTHLVAWCLLGIPERKRPGIHSVILSGSVLKPSFPWDKLIGAGVTRVVNDCAISDIPLVFNQLIVLFTGMAGRVGFSGMEHDRFRNRFFSFGHSGFFMKGKESSDDFMREYWVPLITTDVAPTKVDQRRPPSFLKGIGIFMLNNFEPVKILLYLVLLWWPLHYYAALREDASRHKQTALARQIGQSADLALNNPAVPLQTGVLLATESLRRFRLLGSYSRETQFSLQRGMELLPPRVSSIVIHEPALAAGFTFGGKHILTAASDGTVRMWDPISKKEIKRIDGGGTGIPVLSKSGNLLATGGIAGPVRIFDVRRELEILEIQHGSAVDVMAFSPNDRYIAIASGGHAAVWDLVRKTMVVQTVHPAKVDAVSFSPDDRHVVFSSLTLARVFDVASGREIRALPHGDDIFALASYSPRGKYLAITDKDGVVIIFDASADHVISRVDRHLDGITSMDFSPDDQYLATASLDHTARVTESATGRLVASMRHTRSVYRVFFSPDGSRIATVDESNLSLWEPLTGREVARIAIESHGDPASFSPDGKYLVMAHGAIIQIFGVEQSAGAFALDERDTSFILARQFYQRQYFTGAPKILSDVVAERHLVVRSPNGEMIASANDKGFLYLAENGNMRLLMPPAKHNDKITAMIFSSDCRFLATAAGQGIRIWDLTTLEEAVRIGSDGPIDEVFFSPDVKYVYTHISGTQDFIRDVQSLGRQLQYFRKHLWRPDDLIDESCSRLTRNLTREEWGQYVGENEPYVRTCPNLP